MQTNAAAIVIVIMFLRHLKYLY